MRLDTSNQFLLRNVLQSVVMNSITSFNWYFFYLECVYWDSVFIRCCKYCKLCFFKWPILLDKMANSTTSSIVDNQLMSTIQVFYLIIFIFIDSINWYCYSGCHTSQFPYSRLWDTIDDWIQWVSEESICYDKKAFHYVGSRFC